jgi:hypothetical protein
MLPTRYYTTVFECQKDKNMTRVKTKVINVKVYIMTLTIMPEILIPQLYIICNRDLIIQTAFSSLSF